MPSALDDSTAAPRGRSATASRWRRRWPRAPSPACPRSPRSFVAPSTARWWRFSPASPRWPIASPSRTWCRTRRASSCTCTRPTVSSRRWRSWASSLPKPRSCARRRPPAAPTRRSCSSTTRISIAPTARFSTPSSRPPPRLESFSCAIRGTRSISLPAYRASRPMAGGAASSRRPSRVCSPPAPERDTMLTPQAIDAAARVCLNMLRTRTRYHPLDASVRSAPLDDAYRIQNTLHRLMTESGRGQIVGWKIAVTSKAMQQMTGADLPASSGPWTRASVAGKVASCVPAFELVEDGDADYKNLVAFTLVAQNTWNGGVVLGAPVTSWQNVDLETAVTRCWINDAPAGQGKAGDALGHPFEAVAWLANLLNSQGRMLTRDMIVMTGSSITTKFPSPGDRVRFAVEGLGEVTLEITR